MKTPTTDVITTSISQALGYPTATPLMRLKGKLALVWDKTGGQGKKGPWTKQSGLIEDNGNKMVFTVWNFKGDLSDAKGKEVVFFNSNESRKSALVLEDDYKDPTKRSLKVDGRQCSVFVDGISDGVPEDDIPMDYSNAPEMVAHAVPPKPQQSNVAPKKAVPEAASVSLRMVKYGRLYKKCLETARLVGMNEAGELLESPEIKDIATTFFIQGVKDGLLEIVEATENDMSDKDLF